VFSQLKVICAFRTIVHFLEKLKRDGKEENRDSEGLSELVTY